LIVLPYNLILQKSARESLGIDLKNKVVIFDEAHNLIDVISGIYSIMIEKSVIERSKSQLNIYLERYKSRLSGKNLIYIKQIQKLLDALFGNLLAVEQRKGTFHLDKFKDQSESIITVNDFVHDLGIDNLNLFKIEKYLKESRLAQKLNGFVVDLASDPDKTIGGDKFVPKHVSALQQVQAFLMSLTNSQVDGRILIKRNGRYMCLIFREKGIGVQIRFAESRWKL
jgi:chromosome transmission fidelity protein 1